MSGLIRVSEEADWVAANWIFDHVKRMLLPALQEKDPSGELAQCIAEDDQSGMSFIVLTDLPSEHMMLLHAAVEEVRSRLASEGPEAIADPSFFSALMERVAALADMIGTDARLQQARGG